MTRINPEFSPGEVPFAGRAFQIRLTRRIDPGGTVREFEVVERVPAVAVVAEVEGRLVAVRQERPAVNRVLYEIPAGKVDAGETPEEAARRELSEETGYRAGPLAHLLDVYPSPGYTTEVVSFFWAPAPTPGKAHPDPGEEIEVCLLQEDQVRAIISGPGNGPLNGLFYTGASWWLRRERGTSA